MRIFVCSFVMLSLSGMAHARAFQVDPNSSTVEFLAVGKPGFLKIKGTGAKVSGEVKEVNDSLEGSLTVSLTDVKTGISLRDEHMHGKYLETQKFPTASLLLKKVVFKDKASGDCTFTGELAIKSTSKPVEGTCQITGLGSNAPKVTASMDVKIADFPVGVPSHMGVTVAETVTISAVIAVK